MRQLLTNFRTGQKININMISMILANLRQALLLWLFILLFIGAFIPLIFTNIAQLFFPTAASGGLIIEKDQIVGAKLIGQEFSKKQYFWGRMSATTPPYNAAFSAASNFSMGNSTLLERANERMANLPANNKIPLSLVTSSASGIDPHITPQAAYFQIERVAKARNMPADSVKALVDANMEKPYLGLIGSLYVNVLSLNIALDKEQSAASQKIIRKDKP